MKAAIFDALQLKAQERRWELNKRKRHDYASRDVLSNFKRVSAAAKALRVNVYRPYGVALFMELMKIDRIINLAESGKSPENESVEGSFDDKSLYGDLEFACLLDSEEIDS